MNPSLRILYVAPLHHGSTSAHRLNALAELGHQIIALDTTPLLFGGPRLLQTLQHYLSWGPGVRRLNAEFVRLARQERPELVWVDKGNRLWRQSIDAAKAASGAVMVHYNPDDPFGASRRGWRLLLDAMSGYDVHLVPRDANIAEYRQAGARRVIRFHWGYDPAVHRPLSITPEDRQRLGGPAGFVGDFEEDRARAMLGLASQGVPVRIWGPNWQRMRQQHPNLRIEHRPLWGDDYARAVCAFDINLGFLRKANRDLSTTRSVEIPACGAFMLAERSSEHLAMFEEGKEAEFFANDQELLSKTRHYLEHPQERAAIAAAGRQRCIASRYGNPDRLRQMVGDILSLG